MLPNDQLTGRRRKRALAANPAFEEPGASKTEAWGGGSCAAICWVTYSLASVGDGFDTRFDFLGYQFHSYRLGNTLLNIPLLLCFKKWPVCTQVHIVRMRPAVWL